MYSVIIPLYNKAKYIRRTINSVLNQSYPDFEIIVVDDGSTDNSVCIVKEFNDDRIKLISQTNFGVSTARNNGILNAKHEYIALLDADDYWDENYLLYMSQLIEKYPREVMFSTQFASVLDNGNIVQTNKIETDKEIDIIDVIEYGKTKGHLDIHTSSMIFQKNIFSKVGYFNPCVSFYEDAELIIKIALYHKLVYLNKEPLSYYDCNRSDSYKLTNNLPSKEKHLMYYVDDIFSPYYKKHPNLEQFINRFKILSLLNYFLNGKEKYYVRENLKKIDNSYFTLKERIIFSIPPIMYKIYKKIMK